VDLKITPEVLRSFSDKDSKKEHFRSLYEKHDFLTAYAKHTDLRVKDDPKWAIGRGDEWESHGKLQLQFLVDEGMRPHHRLLDVGCGVGRASRRFVPYLAPEHYVGVDISEEALSHASRLAIDEGWNKNSPAFILNSDLNLDHLAFDYIWAHSVFTHLPPQQIEKMIGNAAKLLPPGGKFLFTYKPAEQSQRSGLKQYQHPVSAFDGWAKKAGMKCEALSKMWPAHQRTIRLTKK
jgi:cyclopropane fatty-acyl-phospholipid synthase-like methyltransferase